MPKILLAGKRVQQAAAEHYVKAHGLGRISKCPLSGQWQDNLGPPFHPRGTISRFLTICAPQAVRGCRCCSVTCFCSGPQGPQARALPSCLAPPLAGSLPRILSTRSEYTNIWYIQLMCLDQPVPYPSPSILEIAEPVSATHTFIILCDTGTSPILVPVTPQFLTSL